ncbi:MAG: DUF4358 domain-containing protein [Lachnospiraceae bacterium]|nr:DUF4358 domain-containing protein [uncultured Acetatifactor sp.]MCI9232653.1 DUF4358 domain-containing protein [Lachnospiraceae bacterium]
MMMKKRLVALCAVALAFLLAGCGGDGGKESSSGSGESSVQESTESAEGTEGAPEESLPEESAAPEESDSADSSEAREPEGAAEGWSQEMEDLKAAAVEAAEEGGYWPDMALEPDMLEMSFGISADMYEDYMAEMPMMSAHVDTLLIIRAKDDKVEAVREALEAYREAKVSDTMQYPMNLGKIQASRVETIGSYVMFVQLGGDTTQAEEEGEEAVVALCQERNDKVIEAVRAKLP